MRGALAPVPYRPSSEVTMKVAIGFEPVHLKVIEAVAVLFMPDEGSMAPKSRTVGPALVNLQLLFDRTVAPIDKVCVPPAIACLLSTIQIRHMNTMPNRVVLIMASMLGIVRFDLDGNTEKSPVALSCGHKCRQQKRLQHTAQQPLS